MVVERTRECGDIRVGLDLLKRAATLAEENDRRSVTREDVCTVYERWCDGFLQALCALE